VGLNLLKSLNLTNGYPNKNKNNNKNKNKNNKVKSKPLELRSRVKILLIFIIWGLKVLMDMAKGNGKTLTTYDTDEIRAILETIAYESIWIETERNLTPLDLFRSGHATKSIVLCIAWMTSCIAYYALTLNATQLSGHIVWNFTLGALISIPSPFVLIVALYWLPRKTMLVAGHLMLGLSAIALAFIPKELSGLVMTFYLLGKFAAGISFCMCYLVTSELYPTNLR
jgi:hypothetical protein